MTSLQQYIMALRAWFREHENPENAAHMQRYMKYQFPFFGLKGPRRKELGKAFMDMHGAPAEEDWPELIRLCFQQPEREMQYFVNDLLKPKSKQLPPALLPTLEAMVGEKSWWDTVDFLSPKLAGAILRRHRDLLPEYPDRWIHSDNRWYQRAAILVQLDWKTETDTQRLFQYILTRAQSQDFFVQKGAGWALRQYSRVASAPVRDFLQTHSLPPLTVREGSKYVK